MFFLFHAGLHPCFVVFDVLLVNGKSIASLPLKERLANLEKYGDNVCVKTRFTVRKQLSYVHYVHFP